MSLISLLGLFREKLEVYGCFSRIKSEECSGVSASAGARSCILMVFLLLSWAMVVVVVDLIGLFWNFYSSWSFACYLHGGMWCCGCGCLFSWR